MKADIVFKTPESSMGMHITVRPIMHRILQQRRLNYAASLSQFQAKTPPIHAVKASSASEPIASSCLQAKLLPKFTSPYRQMNVVPHLTVDDLHTRFRREYKDSTRLHISMEAGHYYTLVKAAHHTSSSRH